MGPIAGGSIHSRVLLVTRGNSFLEAALRLQPGINLYETTPGNYVANAGNYDLTVFDGFVPAQLPSGDLFFINPPAGSYIFGQSGAEIDVSHIGAGSDNQNLLSEVDLSSIHVLRVSHRLTSASWMQSVIVTPETPLLIAGERENRRIAALSFDLHDSDLPLQPSFPILIYNLVSWFLPAPVPGNGQVAPGTPITVQTWSGAQRVTVSGPGQQPVTVAPPFPVTVFDQTDRTGIYTVTQYTPDQERQGAFAVNLFDPLQSQLAPAAQLPIVHSTPFNPGAPSVPRVLREIWPWIAAFLLLVLCAEWWLFSRSYTIRGVSNLERPNPLQQSRPGSRPQQHGVISTLQNQVETQFKAVQKRVTRVRKRLKGKQKSKGKSNANV